MPGFGAFLGKAGGSAEQLFIWGVLQQVIGALTAPYQAALTQAMFSEDPNIPLSPAEAASLVARGLLDEAKGLDQAKKSGIDTGVFRNLVKSAQAGPDTGALVEAYQRGLIPKGSNDGEQLSLFGGLTEAGVRDEWHPILEELATQIPTTAEVMNAWLQGQIQRGEARDRYLKAGGDPTWFQTAYDANGEAPTPVQLLELVNRGIIPWNGTGPRAVSYEQGFLEGPWRNKWEPAFRALAEHVTPPRSVTAMYHAGQLTHDEAAAELKKSGLTPAMIAAYLAPAKHATTVDEHHMAKGDILSLYGEKLLHRDEAVKGLVALKYTRHEAELLLDLTDLKEATAALRSGVTRVRTLYQGAKIDRTGALAALHELGVAAGQARDLVDTWDVTRTHKVREISPAQVEAAVYYNLITEAEGMARLLALGFDEDDAWLALSVRRHAPLRTIPRPPGVGPAPTPPGATAPAR